MMLVSIRSGASCSMSTCTTDIQPACPSICEWSTRFSRFEMLAPLLQKRRQETRPRRRDVEYSQGEGDCSHSCGDTVPQWEAVRPCQSAGLAGVRETGLMWANMLRAFQVGKALTSDEEPRSWMRSSRVAWAQVSWPACHLTKASASAVM